MVKSARPDSSTSSSAVARKRELRASALALAVLTFRGLSAVWPIYVLAALGSAVGAFDLPARGALVPTLVPRFPGRRAARSDASVGDEIQQLATIKEQGVLGDDEFTAAKAKLLGI